MIGMFDASLRETSAACMFGLLFGRREPADP
jgi:hypothetical protein